MNTSFIGVGRMGGAMALNAKRAGFDIAAYDTVAASLVPLNQAGIASLVSIAAAAERDVIVLMLPSDEALQAVIEGGDGLLPHLRPGQIVIDMSTSKLATSQRLAQRVAEQGATLLDAPVSGGTSGAQNGTLSIMVGGEQASFERVLPLLQAMGTTVTHIGGSGMGLVTKFVNQMIMEAAFCAIGEAFTMASKAGADIDLVYQAVRNGLAGSRVMEIMLPTMLSGEWGSGRELTLHTKDGKYALAAAESVGSWAPVTELTHAIFEKAMQAGLGEQSAPAVVKVFEGK